MNERTLIFLIRSFFLVGLFGLLHIGTWAQVAEIKMQASADSKNSGVTAGTRSSGGSAARCSSNDQSFGDALLADLFMGIVQGVAQGVAFATVEAQKSVLQKADRIPNLTSLEAGLEYSTNLSELAFNPSLRGNWGLFATDFRYSLLHDNTGTLKSLDWQVLMLRIPIQNLKLNYGIGFTTLLEPKTTYFESSTGFDLALWQNRINISSAYRWTAKKSEDTRYRQEFKLMGNYRIWQKGRFHLSPSVGVTYQEYFQEHHYLFFSVGVKLRIH